MTFQKAVRSQSNLRLGITGPSGAGKTYTALEIATGIGGAIGLVDTENGSASLYADRFNFAVLNIEPPYTADKFIRAIEDATAAGIKVLIFDSITHEWTGEGGVLDKKNRIDAAGGNSFTNWQKVNPDHEKFVAGLLQAPMHLICTMRSKQDYVLEDRNGKQVPKKVGMAPIQREGMEYEFTTVFDLALTHDATVSKDRTGLFDGQVFKPSRKTGKQLADWLNSGAAPKQPPPPPVPTQPPPDSSPAGTQGAGAAPREKPAMPYDPEDGEKGITLEQWNAAVEFGNECATKDALAEWFASLKRVYGKTKARPDPVWTEKQEETLVAFKDAMKEYLGVK